jgi:hypothetical protein
MASTDTIAVRTPAEDGEAELAPVLGGHALVPGTKPWPRRTRFCSKRLQTSGGGLGELRRGRASLRRSCRRDLPAWRRVERPCRSGAASRLFLHRLPCRSCRKRGRSYEPRWLPPLQGRFELTLTKSGRKFYAAARDWRMRQERSRESSACSSRSRPISRAPTKRKWRGRKSSIVRPSRYCSTTAGLT